jgi:hypothetical protein
MVSIIGSPFSSLRHWYASMRASFASFRMSETGGKIGLLFSSLMIAFPVKIEG